MEEHSTLTRGTLVRFRVGLPILCEGPGRTRAQSAKLVQTGSTPVLASSFVSSRSSVDKSKRLLSERSHVRIVPGAPNACGFQKSVDLPYNRLHNASRPRGWRVRKGRIWP